MMRGSKRQRAPGVWELRVYVGADPVTGKRRYVSRTFRGKAREAETCLAALVSEVSRGSHRGTATTLGELVERYLDRFKGSPTTLAGYRSIARCHIGGPIGQRPPLADVPLRKLDAASLDSFYDYLASAKGLSASRIRQTHALLRGALAMGLRWGWIATNPAKDAMPPTVRRPELSLPGIEDLAAALRAAEAHDPELATFIRLSAATGARRGELCGLRWACVDLKKGRITFERAVVQVAGQGVIDKDTKNHSRRTIAIDAATLALLRDHHARMMNRADACGRSLTKDAYVFSREADGSAPWRPDTVTHQWEALRTKAGLSRIRLHDLRHFQATMLLAAGVPVKNVSARLGHRDAATTLNIYTHFLADADHAAAEVVGTSSTAGEKTNKRPLTTGSESRNGKQLPTASALGLDGATSSSDRLGSG